MIEVQGVAKSFGATRALDGVDLEVPAASVLGLLGPNGAGKTTLVKVLATLIKPDSGTARVAGLDVVEQATAVRSVIGLAGQYAAVDEMLTGRENLEMVGRLYRLSTHVARQRAEEALERLALTDAADRPVRTYSGGHASAPRPRRQPGRAAPHPDPRRADHRARSPHSHRAVGLHEAARPGRDDGSPHHPVPGGGRRAGELHRRDRPRSRHRSGHRGRVEVAARRRRARGGCGARSGHGSRDDRPRPPRCRAVPGGRRRPPPDHPHRGGRAALSSRRCGHSTTREIPIADLALRRPSLDDVFLALTGHKTTAGGDGIEGNGAGRPPGPRRRRPERSST